MRFVLHALLMGQEKSFQIQRLINRQRKDSTFFVKLHNDFHWATLRLH
jgi:hypothetical protein